SMSTIPEFFGSSGFTSPYALPTSFSYWPTLGHEYPPNVGDSLTVISIFVIRASAAVRTAPAARATAMLAARGRRRSVLLPILLCGDPAVTVSGEGAAAHYRHGGRAAALGISRRAFVI